MTPRRYEMRTRSAAVAQTRQRIIDEAIRLFAEQTAAATNMDDIARSANVSPATVYRHFGDFDGLAEACAQTAFAIAEIPTPEQAAIKFAELPDLEARLHRFIDLSCHCYERAADWLAAERRERHLPAFARTVAREEAALEAIVRGLLKPIRPTSATVAVVKTLLDFPFWQSLVAAGLPHAEVASVMQQLVMQQLFSNTLVESPDTKPSRTTKERGTDARNLSRDARTSTRQG